MGVSGSGKTTIGKLLAERFSLRFFDGDDYHSKNNVQKMSRGEPLTDEDREDWLASLAELIQSERPIVLACSALKTEYREYLSESDIGLRFVFLDLIRPAICRNRFIPGQVQVFSPQKSSKQLH